MPRGERKGFGKLGDRLGKFLLTKQIASKVESHSLLGVVGSRHVTYKYNRLGHKSSFLFPSLNAHFPGEFEQVIFCVQGVISPLLANLYLHWFDTVFHRPSGPAHWAKAKLVRYADDLVVLARYQGPQLRAYIETKLETWMGLEINREKTRVVDLKQEGASLDFLGYTFRFDRDLRGRGHKYLNVQPSKKALLRERAKLRAMTSRHVCFQPIPDLIAAANRQTQGWANYFKLGYPRMAFRTINAYLQERLACHLRRRSQRPYRPPKSLSLYAHLERLGLRFL